MNLKIGLFVLVAIATRSLCAKDRYDNFHLYGAIPHTDEQVEQLDQIEQHLHEYDFWSLGNKNIESTIMVPPNKLSEFEDIMESLNITYEIKAKNVQELIDNERPKIQPRAYGWTDYGTWEQIYEWMDQMNNRFPAMSIIHVGYSFQGRPIQAAKISYKPNNPTIFVESNIHAREWITSATATWLINELLTSQDPAVRDIAENFDWIIIPILNIDGFHHSHTTSRMWRKTRQPHSSICPGADANRNFDLYWNTVGSSSFACAENYAGPQAFSEPEARLMADLIAQVASTTKMIISFHSFGQYLMFPYGHTTDPTYNHNILLAIGNAGGHALSRRYGTDYLVGPSSTVLYRTSGSSVDWAYARYNIPLAFTFELRDRRNGRWGFILPADQIIPNCLELLDGLLAMILEARRLGQL